MNNFLLPSHRGQRIIYLDAQSINPPTKRKLALKFKTKKTTIKRSGSSPRVEPIRRTARAAERRFEVVFKFLIFRQ